MESRFEGIVSNSMYLLTKLKDQDSKMINDGFKRIAQSFLNDLMNYFITSEGQINNQSQNQEYNLNFQLNAFEALKSRFENSLNKLDRGPLLLNSKINDATKLEASIKEELKFLKELQTEREELESKIFTNFNQVHNHIPPLDFAK
jgi:peptidoglycan hydrolase CwlO-like protein